MASRFGARIIPFGVVGEDDICEVSVSSVHLFNNQNFQISWPTDMNYGQYVFPLFLMGLVSGLMSIIVMIFISTGLHLATL